MNTGHFSLDLRSRVLAAIDAGASYRGTARKFNVSAATCLRWHKAWKEERRLLPLEVGGDRRSHRIEEWADAIFSILEKRPDITLNE